MPAPMLTVRFRRHYLIWHVWEVSETHDGRVWLIATGAEITRQRAHAAADIWQRMYLRSRSLD